MQNISSNQKEHLYEGGDVGVTITGETLDGDLVTITEDDIIEGTLTIERNWSHGSTIEIGCADTSELVFELDNSDGRWNAIRLEGTRLTVVLDIAGEPLQAGIFTVDEPPRKLTTMQIRALDDMARFNRPYVPGIAYPATLRQILMDCCSQCGVALHTTEFVNDDYVVSQQPEGDDITFHHVVAWVAELAGCNAWIDHLARLRLSWYGENQPETPAMEFTRASTAYHPETGEEIPANTPVYVEFAGGRKGSLMVEGVENLLTENQSSFETSSQWTTSTNFLHVQSEDWSFHGNYSSKATKNSNAVGQMGQATSIGSIGVGTLITGLEYVYVPPESPYIGARVDLRFRWVGGASAAASSTADRYTLSEGVNILTVTKEIDQSDRTTIRLDLVEVDAQSTGSFLYIDALIISQNDYFLPWHPGGSTRANPVKRITLPEALPQEFGVGVWFKPLHTTIPVIRSWLRIRREPHTSANRIYIITNADVNSVFCAFVKDGTSYISVLNGAVEAGKITGIYYHQEPGKYTFYVRKHNGEIVSGSRDVTALTGLTTILVGCSVPATQYAANAVFADFVLHDRPEDIDPEGYLSRVPGGGST